MVTGSATVGLPEIKVLQGIGLVAGDTERKQFFGKVPVVSETGIEPVGSGAAGGSGGVVAVDVRGVHRQLVLASP